MAKRFQFATSTHGDDKWSVQSFQGVEAINEPFKFKIRLRAEAPDLEHGLVGESATLTLNGQDGSRTIAGVVSAARLEDILANGALYRVKLTPWLRSLSLTVDSRIFQDTSVPDIVREVLDEHHIAQRWLVRRKYPERTYVVQYEESDLAFVERLLAEEGIFYAVHTAAQGDTHREVIVLADDTSGYESIAGPSRLPFNLSDALQHDEEVVYELIWGRHFRSGSTELTGFDFRRPTVFLNAKAEDKQAVSRALERYEHDMDWNAHVISSDSARVRLEQHRQGAFAGHGRSRCGRLTPGCLFELDGHARSDVSGQLAVVKVEHWGRTPEETIGVDGLKSDEVYRNTFTCIRSDVIARPRPPKPRKQQIVDIATVVGPKGEEIYTDEHGRVKVQFHWDRRGEGNERSSCWIRTLEPWAGAAWGTQFVPRIGMEVAVSFAGGSADRPIILGTVYNGANPPPFKLPEHKTQSGIRTRTTPGGNGSNELRFDDAAGAEQIYLHGQRDYVEVIEHDRMREVRGQESIVVRKTRHMAIDEDHVRLVKGNELVTIEKNQVLHVMGCQLINISGAGGRVAPEKAPVVDGNQGGPDAPPTGPANEGMGAAPSTPQDALGPEEAEAQLAQTLQRAEKRKGAKLAFLTEQLPDSEYDRGMQMQTDARTAGAKTVEQYLAARTLANQAPLPDMADKAAPIETALAEARDQIDAQLKDALEPAPDALHPLQTAVVGYLTEADRTAVGAQELLAAAKEGNAPNPASDILGRLGGGGGGEDEFTREGDACGIHIEGIGTITATAELKLIVGGSSITLLPGEIKIVSPTINISGGDLVGIDAPTINVSGDNVNIDKGTITVTGSSVGINGGPIDVKGDAITIGGSTVDITGTPIKLN